MEEKTEKKTTKKKPLDENKVKEAKKKVNELLAGTGLEDKEEAAVFSPPIQAEDEFFQTTASDQATTWLNEQVAALTQQVENYEKMINQLKTDNQNMMNMLNNGQGGNMAGSALEAKVIEVFKHFESVYTGRKYGQAFVDAKLSWPQGASGVLDVLLATFPFLHNVREYRHKG